MYDWIKKLVLRLLKVPPEPTDPMGDVKSLRVFRASYNFFRYRFYLWLFKNAFGLLSAAVVGAIVAMEFHSKAGKHFDDPASLSWIMVLIVAGVLLYSLLQTLISYVGLRLDYELRWYKVSDRSLRIREGVVFVREMTMTFANIQNIEIVQGPIQRLFRIADLKVESAGGSIVAMPQKNRNPEMTGFHVAYFRGIDNAEEIRDLMRSRLEKYRTAGLGVESTAAEMPAESGWTFDAGSQPLLEQIRDEAARFRTAAECLEPRN